MNACVQNFVDGRKLRKKTHCLRGHEYTAANTIPSVDGKRTCRACRIMYNAAQREAYLKPDSPRPAWRACIGCRTAPAMARRQRCAPCAETYATRQPTTEERAEANEYQRRRHREDPRSALLIGARNRARERGLAFDISREDIVVPAHCPLLGIRIQIGDGKVGPHSPTLDRKVPALGYVRSNIWVISHRANAMKLNASLSELRALVHNLERLEWI